MKKYRIVETKNSFTGESNFKLQKKSIFGFWYNPLNIDAYTTGIYDNLKEAEYDLNMLLSKTTKKIVFEYTEDMLVMHRNKEGKEYGKNIS